jgi:hypothetical protein
MSDYLAKPVELQGLAAMLAKWLPVATTAALGPEKSKVVAQLAVQHNSEAGRRGRGGRKN